MNKTEWISRHQKKYLRACYPKVSAEWPASSSPFWALSSSFIPASSNLHSSWCELKTQRRPLLLSNFETYWYDPHLPTDTPLQRCLWRFWKFQVGPPQLVQETALPSLKRKTNFCCWKSLSDWILFLRPPVHPKYLVQFHAGGSRSYWGKK